MIDGDTIEVEIEGRKYTVRYIGINTPETVDPRRPVERYGKEASEKNKELVGGKVVTLEKDVSETDRYGRLLRYVYVDAIFVNAELVRLGYAQASSYPPDVRYQQLFQQMERQARENRRGLWSGGGN
ncbi:MAG: thermonuclease family protein [Chloroflexi bacterium]|nr:thermonuclease family protein [Chloroflexota bacterium]